MTKREPRPYTLAKHAYVIVIQAGAIMLILIYWYNLADFTWLLRPKSTRPQIATNLIFAFLPAAIAGLLLDDWIEAKLGDNIRAVAGALIVGAVIMLIVEKWRHAVRCTTQKWPRIYDLSIRQLHDRFLSMPSNGQERVDQWHFVVVICRTITRECGRIQFFTRTYHLAAASGYKIVTDGSHMVRALEIGF